MKIIAGKLKGRNFYMPEGIRPTQNILRKVLFDILGQDMEGIDFIDIFAGSGAVGFEALSRGARRVVLIEREPKAVEAIEENILLLSKGMPLDDSSCELIPCECFTTIKSLHDKGAKFDIAFIDPPYRLDLAKKALKTIGSHDILQPACTLVIQHEKREILPKEEGRFFLFREKAFGDTLLSFYQGRT